MKYNKEYFINLAKNKNKELNKKPTVVITCPYDINTLEAIYECQKNDLLNIILVGQKELINKAIGELNIKEFTNYKLINADNNEDAANKTMQLLKNNEADILMKGLIDTSLLLKAFLNKEFGLRTDKLLSHVCLSFHENYDKYYIITDAAVNISPTLEQKKKIIENAVWFAHKLGNNKPKVANLCAKEKVYEKMPATIEAQALHEMNLNNEIKDCVVSGPMQIDIAIDKESSQIKNCDDEVSGQADILMCPNIEVANILSKGLTYLGGWSFTGVIIGAKVPFILTSRSTSIRDKIVSIALACICSN